jgi:AAA15 family ATPase/GTPase
MITEILIRNFKCFKSLTVPELGRVTLVGGRNNVGKTALLEALFLLFDRINPNMVTRQYGQRGIESVASRPESIWAPIFHNYDLSKEILISTTLNGEQQSVKFKFNPNYIPPPSNTLPRRDTQIPTDKEAVPLNALDIEYSDKKSKTQTSHLLINPTGQELHADYLHTLTQAYFLASKKHTSSTQVSNEFSNIAKQGRENELVEFLSIIEPRLKTLKVITEGSSSFVYGELEHFSRAIPVNYMGEGMEKLLSIALAILHAKDGCVLVDEMENGLHFSVLSQIWKAIGQSIRKYNCQIIATTHSYECMEMAQKGLCDIPEDFRYIRLDRQGEDIAAKLSNYEMLSTAISTNLEVR